MNDNDETIDKKVDKSVDEKYHYKSGLPPYTVPPVEQKIYNDKQK